LTFFYINFTYIKKSVKNIYDGQEKKTVTLT